MSAEPPRHIGKAIPQVFAEWCRERRAGGIRLVADGNTWAVLGKDVEAALKAGGIAVSASILDRTDPVVDANSVLRLLLDLQQDEELLVAVGSGTITDLVRMLAHRARRDFVSLPTAPSVDAYSSAMAAVIVEGVKRTFPARPPLAIFADIEVLARAPRPMIAAGFADAFCKFTALADWRLGALFWGEPWEAGVAGRGLAAARSVVDAAPAISAGEAGGVEILFAALLEFGSCMAEVGHSRPASGAEHQYSHFWEMRLLREGRPPILHGLKVGVGAVIASGWWDRIRGLSRREAAVLLGRARRPGREAESRLIEAAYGPDAPEIIGTQERFIGMDDASWAGLIEDLIGRWDEVLGLAAMVPTEAETRRLLALVGCPCEPAELGLGVAEIELARSSAHWLRDRFTVRKLGRMLFELG